MIHLFIKCIAWIFILVGTLFICQAQQTVQGTVTDKKKQPLLGANVFIEGTYDGAVTDDKGHFSFTTDQQGTVILQISYLTHETLKLTIVIPISTPLTIILKQQVNVLDAVVISAGQMEAGDKSRVSVLKPLDIVTTAGSAGNIIAALQTLPGTQPVGEDGRLFVRGGEADETQTYVDGLRVAQPYGANVANTPTRGRFSPFLFQGISFSTGGYSVEFGDALSGILQLNTQDDVAQKKTEFSFMTVGAGVGHTQKWGNRSVTLNTSYINLAPYQWMVPQNINWNRPVQSGAGEAVYREKIGQGTLKTYVAFDTSTLDLNQEQAGTSNTTRVGLANRNLYANSTFKTPFGAGWNFQGGLSVGYSQNRLSLQLYGIQDQERAFHSKFKLQKKMGNGWKTFIGAEYFHTRFVEDFAYYSANLNQALPFTNNNWALFNEWDWAISNRLAVKAGGRWTYNVLTSSNTIRPRISMAWKCANNHQISAAYGIFDQLPAATYLKFSQQLTQQQATHYLMNYQYTIGKKLLRFEAYHKQYDHLIQFDGNTPAYGSTYAQDGYGYARGIDVFWRDGSSVKNLEYWISYTYIDSKRKYKNYAEEVTPSFVANQSWSVVTKYWIDKLKSQVGFTWNYNLGRPYNNPNSNQFMSERTPANSNLSFNWAYLLGPQKILYFSASNILGTRNVFGYEYTSTPNTSGVYNRREITQTADRFFFVGFFWTLSTDKKDNQLKNL
ncbi:MAG: TonB-dependent receptor [Flavobacterium sp. BFFFF2]|nr:MAG: TonB-dependent receptor [Flavobacterium sp. BFFFF2]